MKIDLNEGNMKDLQILYWFILWNNEPSSNFETFRKYKNMVRPFTQDDGMKLITGKWE